MLEDATSAAELDEAPRVWVSANTLKAVETQRAALQAAKPTTQGKEAAEEAEPAAVEGEAEAEAEAEGVDSPSTEVQQMMQMGFPREACEAALSVSDGNAAAGIELLLIQGPDAFMPTKDTSPKKPKGKGKGSASSPSKAKSKDLPMDAQAALDVAAEVITTSLPPLRLLFYVGPQGDLEDRRESPGCWYEVAVTTGDKPLDARFESAGQTLAEAEAEAKAEDDQGDPSPCVASVFALIPHGRRVIRSLVATTDARYCLHDLTPPSEKRDAPWRPLARHQAGNLFGFLLTKEGKQCSTAGECCGASPGLAASLTVQRTRAPRAPPPTGPAGEAAEAEWPNEIFVPERCLRGLLPAALTTSYRFWRTSPNTLRGYPKATGGGDNERELLVQLYKGRTGVWQAIVRRLPPASTAIDPTLAIDDGEPGPSSSATFSFPSGTETLLNLTDTSREGGALRRMAAILTKLESLSHILVWSVSDARPGEECAISTVELPRLRNAFTVTEDDDGVTRMYSQSDAGKFVPDYVPPSIGRHAAGIPHAVVLADRLDQYYLLVPAATVQRPQVQICPFSCQLVVERPSVLDRSSATYLYSVHREWG